MKNVSFKIADETFKYEVRVQMAKSNISGTVNIFFLGLLVQEIDNCKQRRWLNVRV